MKTHLLLFALFFTVLAVGEWQKVPTSENVRTLALFGAKRINFGINSVFHHKMIDVLTAERQVVAGYNYKINITIQETECKKSQKSFEAAQKCNLLSSKSLKVCQVIIYQRPWLNETKVTSFSCSETSNKAKRSNVESLHERLFEKFMKKYERSYSNEYEKVKRFNIFRANLKKIKDLNSNEQGTAVYGITKFSDLNENEFRKYLGFRPDLARADSIPPPAKIPSISMPKSFDWRHYNVVTEVKNQQQCGSCWAFSTTGNIEGQWALKKKKLVSLSEQELVDCDKVDQGCNGGLPSNAYKEIIRLGGLETEKEYPYEADDEKCQFKKSDVRVYINSSVSISQNETEMAVWLVKNGPISIGINANAMQFYYGGISHPWKFLCNPENLDHGVLIVGYGVHSYPLFKTTLPFWIIKNSWGADWGEQGYYRVYRGDGTCGLNRMATSSVVD
uniref:Cathepsin F-like cysteine peptidase protein n=1 Tax=Tityus serrulatus TaxID=6887 RepID=U6JPB2_TITSE|nr:cathepsin F-like cysteine peptidase protein [Tityus serrulatus]